ncbi:calmodulin-regulated spectrin-associated protein 1-B-like [Limanda limanda]|uniref:calmodulin-regulated spectrin-associated protein 1-B-like n=1 Tax=Limanda limanda TaxID=27771 RepID=UPI0029C83495|nr:calmodulin-regulated spectrin-associated protein 1-B-like [Limanda limanda]
MVVDSYDGGDNIRRRVNLTGLAMDVTAFDMYDYGRARIAANLRWLFTKAYGIDHIPEDLTNPFYTDQYDEEHIKPPVVRLLLSCELYCRVCSLILELEQAAALQSHGSVIQALSRKRVYVVDSDDTPVTDGDLACVPIKISAHMPMIDALMMSYTLQCFSSLSASKDRPSGLEDASPFSLCRPLSPNMLHSDSDSDMASGVSLSTDSLSSDVINPTPEHQSSVHRPSQGAMPRVNSHSLLAKVNSKDNNETLVAVAEIDSPAVPKQTDRTQATATMAPPCLSAQSKASSKVSVCMTSFADRKTQQRFGSSTRTKPDGSESSEPSWRLTRDQRPSSPRGGNSGTGDGSGGVPASEHVHLQMQLQEKRRDIEHQREERKLLSARRRQNLGNEALLHIVKKGGGRRDTLPNPLKADIAEEELNGRKGPSNKDDLCVEVLRGDKEVVGTPPPGALEADKNEAIGRLQQQMMQMSLQQEMLMKQNVQSPPAGAALPPPRPSDKISDSKSGASFRHVEHISGSTTTHTRKTPKLGSDGSSRSKPSELKIPKEQTRPASRILTPTQSGSQTLPHQRLSAGARSPRAEQPGSTRNPTAGETIDRLGLSTNFRLPDEANVRLLAPEDVTAVTASEVTLDDTGGGNGEQKTAVGIFSKLMSFITIDEQKAVEELERKRAAFLLRQRKKAEKAQLRKQQLEAESELRREEARRKAEEGRLREEEEKISIGHFSTCSSPPDNLSSGQSGSSLSLTSTATSEADSAVSEGAGSQRSGSGKRFPGRGHNSRTADFTAEYTGPKLFKELSAKSNKQLIHNAISHCCLAGKVNEQRRSQILEELEKCESNHLMILFRDGSCKFRALYTCHPGTEEIKKLTAAGPKSISRKMIDKLYKYSSERKQFNLIRAKTVSVSVDALTIHNHLWQAKRRL